MRLARALAAAAIAGAISFACGGTSLPAPPPCVAPTPTPTVLDAFAATALFVRTIEAGELQLGDLLAQFRLRYPEGRFYRTPVFRDDWVRYAGAATCLLGDMERLSLPPTATPLQREREEQLDAILAEYRRVLERGSEAVRQRNTSDYRDFNRRVDQVAARLRDWVDQGLR